MKKPPVKKRKKNPPQNGNHLTFLSSEEANKFLSRHKGQIFFECKKKDFIPTLSVEDLMQECKIKLIAGYHTFDSSKSSEKTWVRNVVKKTLNSLITGYINNAKNNFFYKVPKEEKNTIPIYNFSYENFFTEDTEQEEQLSFEEMYEPCQDGRLTFGTITFSPEEIIYLIETIQYLKASLPRETYLFLRKRVFNDFFPKEFLLSKKYKPIKTLKAKSLKKYKTYSTFSNKPIKEIKFFSQIADIFINHLGFNKENILSREMTIDVHI